MKNRKTIIIVCLVLSIIFLSTGTFAYFRFGATGNININTGELMLLINDKSATQNEQFEVILTNDDGSKLKPGDSGSFDLTLNATGSSLDVSVVLEIIRTNLPTNLKFYEDEEHTKEFTSKQYNILKSASMIQDVTIYWYWENLSVSNDNDFMFTEISATINGTISYYDAPKTLYNDLLAMDYTLDTNVDFSMGASETNGQGLMMRDGTQNDEYPIVYYRGDVNNNNVIYAGYCWLIVRTTETGGVKLLFNGPVVNNGGTKSCTNYSGVGGQVADEGTINAYIGYKTFNEGTKSPVYAGYMYNDTNTYVTVGAPMPVINLDAAGYITHLSDISVIENGLDNETGRHTQNKTDSFIKGVVDDWYEENILGKPEEVLLEDTVWCNDRSIISETYSLESFAQNNKFSFAASTRLKENTILLPSLECNREIDKFTVNSENGNGDLDYPIGLLTADEINLAGYSYGSSQTTYLTLSSRSYWSMSPDYFSGDMVRSAVYFFGLNNASFGSLMNNDMRGGARVSVSLTYSTLLSGGDGSFETPYIVE